MAPTKEEIKKWLKGSGMTREELAKKCGVNKRTVDLWLSSARGVPAKSLLIIQRLMQGEDDSLKRIHLPLSEEQWAIVCEAMKGQSFLEFVNTALQNAAKEKEAARKKFVPVETAAEPLDYEAQIMGNTAAGKPADGGTIPQDIRLYRELENGEYILQVNGKSMEPKIPDGALVIVRKYEDYLFPKPGTLVVYNEGNDYTLKKLTKRKNPKTGETEYILKSINPAYKDVEPIAEGKISAVYVETLSNWEKA